LEALPISRKSRLLDQRKELIYRHFQKRDGRRDNPENDQNEAGKGPIVRPVRLMMDKRHISSQSGFCDPLGQNDAPIFAVRPQKYAPKAKRLGDS
jgi:hypothetical protein